MGGRLSAPGGFFANADFDYETRIALGAVPSGVGDVGLVLAILDRITDGDPQSWFDAWSAVAADLAVRGDEALGRGHLATASWAFVAASEYYAKALAFVDGMADQSVLLPTFRQGRACWEKVIDASAGRFVRLPVPYEDTMLPGYLLRPPGIRRRDLVYPRARIYAGQVTDVAGIRSLLADRATVERAVNDLVLGVLGRRTPARQRRHRGARRVPGRPSCRKMLARVPPRIWRATGWPAGRSRRAARRAPRTLPTRISHIPPTTGLRSRSRWPGSAGQMPGGSQA